MYPRKVMIISETLSFGGKESHVVALCRELTKNGIKTVAISNGGSFVPMIKALGVLHMDAPIHSQDKNDVKISTSVLEKAFNMYKPDLVHAHIENPQKWLYKLCKKYKIPLVTSVYKKHQRGLSNTEIKWLGSKVITFNEHLREYLHSECKIQNSDLFLSVEGIDTDLFCNNEEIQNEIREELQIPRGSKVVFSVAKLEPEYDVSARRLILEAPTIRRRFPNVLIFIAGNGSTFEELKEKVAQINEIAGETYVILLGGRMDVHRIYNVADVCVASSRTALEAMSTSCPVVLAGSKGFLGILDSSTIEAALSTNFSCEGFPYPSENTFVDSIVFAFMRDSAAKKALGEFGRNIVLNNYPSKKMSLDTQRAYFMAMLESPRARYDFILCGYYGYGTAGDNLLLECIVKNLRMRNNKVSICIINKDKNYDYAPLDVALVDRHSPMEIKRFIKRSKVLLYGGGNLLQDDTGLSSLLYYLYVLHLGKRYKLKTMLYGNGIGPLHNTLTKALAKGALKKVDTITVRDRKSHELVKSIQTKARRVLLTADEMFSALKYPLAKPQGTPTSNYIAVSVCELTRRDRRLWDKLAMALDNFSRASGMPVIFVPLGDSLDLSVCTEVAGKMQSASTIFEGTAEEQVAIITNSHFTVAMRPQAMIFATAAAVPCATIGWDAQIRALCQETESELFFEANPFDEQLFFDRLVEAVQTYGQIEAKVKTMSGVLSGQAMENSTEAYRLLTQKIMSNR